MIKIYIYIYIYDFIIIKTIYLLALLGIHFANIVAMKKLSIEQLNTNDGKYKLEKERNVKSKLKQFRMVFELNSQRNNN